MSSVRVSDAASLPIDRLESLLRRRSTPAERLAWHLGGTRRALRTGHRDVVLGLLGLAVAVGIAWTSWTTSPAGLPVVDAPLLWLGLARVVALLWPARIVHERHTTEMTLDTAVLVYWLVTDVPVHALVGWIVATTVAELLRRHVLTTVGIDVGIAALAALAAALVFVTVLAAPGLPGVLPMACVSAAVAYVLVDHVLSAFALRALGDRRALARIGGAPALLGGAVTVALALVVCAMSRLGPGSILGGASVSVAMCLVIGLTSALTAIADDRARLRHVVTFLHRMPTFPDDATAVREIEATARSVVGTDDVVVRPWPPAAARREIGFSLDGPIPSRVGTDGGRWLVARIRDRDPSFHPAEEAALETLALVAGDGLALRRAARETRWLATHDPLTGLANRAELLERMIAVENRRDVPAGATSAVALIDIDGFKAVNDEISHEAGDHVLAVLAPRIAEAAAATTGAGALAARLGGDEFAVLLPDAASAAQVQAMCEALRTAIRRPVDWHGRALHLDASIGFSLGPRIVTTSLLREADAAMYLVKHSGKGGIGRCVASGAELGETAAEPLHTPA